MATATIENGIMRRSGKKAPVTVDATVMRAELETNVISAIISGMNKDAFILGDALDICPASCFVTPDIAPLAEALHLLRVSGQRPCLTSLAVQMRDRAAKDAERYAMPDMERLAKLATTAWGASWACRNTGSQVG